MIVLASGGLGISEVGEILPRRPNLANAGLSFSSRQMAGLRLLGFDPAFVHVHGRRRHGVFLRLAKIAWATVLADARARDHALIVLVLLGVFLRSGRGTQTNWTFMDVVSQIGLGYTFLFLLWGKPRLWQGVAAAAILVGYWLLFAVIRCRPRISISPRSACRPIGRT